MPYLSHLCYEETGAGRPVILIHCPALSLRYWQPLVDRLKGICRCIAVDLRGHGRSGRGGGRWSFAACAADLAMLTRQLQLAPKPILVGYSSGASICLEAALTDPELYGGLALIGGFSECSTLYLRAKVAVGITATRLGLSRLVGRSVVSTNNAGPDHTQSMLPDAEGTDPQSLLAYYRETSRADFTARLAEIRQPALLLYGAKDESMHPYCRILQRGLPNARSVFVPGADHRVPTREPTATADLLAEFITSLEPDETAPLAMPTYHHPGADIHPWDG